MRRGRLSIRMNEWKRSMLGVAMGCFTAAVALPAWAQLPGVPAVPNTVDAAVDTATDTAVDAAANVNSAADAAADVGVDAATNVEAGAANAVDATTQGGIDAGANLNVDAATDVPALRGGLGTDVDAGARVGTDAANIGANTGIGLDTQTRFGAAASLQNGTLVLGDVASGSLAARAGLRASDEIVSINGTQVRTSAAYDTAIRGASGPATIQYRRGGEMHTARVELPPLAPQQRQQSYYRGPDAVQSGGAMQKGGGPVQKGGYTNGPVQNSYYVVADCSGGRRGHHHHRHGHHRHHRGRR